MVNLLWVQVKDGKLRFIIGLSINELPQAENFERSFWNS